LNYIKLGYVKLTTILITILLICSSIPVILLSNIFLKIAHIFFIISFIFFSILIFKNYVKLVQSTFPFVFLILCFTDSLLAGWSNSTVLMLLCTIPFVFLFFNLTRYLDFVTIIVFVFVVLFNLSFILLPDLRLFMLHNIMMIDVIDETVVIKAGGIFFWNFFALEIVIITITYISTKGVIANFSEKERRLSLYNDQLKADNINLKSAWYTAKKIQKLFIPKYEYFDKIKNFQIQADFKPFSYLGGDYYDIYVDNNDKISIYIGDISGHDVESGLFMVAISVTIKDYISMNKNIREIYKAVNSSLCYLNNKLSKEKRKMMTLLILKQITEYKWLFIGQHEKILIYRNRQDIFEVVNTSNNSILLGFFEDIKEYCKISDLTIYNEDIMFLYTDGLEDVMNLDFIKETIKNNKNNLFEIRNIISNKIDTLELKDDISYLVVKKDFKDV